LVLVIATGIIVSMLALRAVRIGQLRREIDALDRRGQVARAEQQLLEALLASVRDPAVIEGIARRWLGLVFPGEEKAIFIEEE
jgi:cell division protein FtsB